MSRRRHTPEQIITGIERGGGGSGERQNGGDGEPGVGDQRADVLPVEAGVRGMKVDQARRFKELEKENARLKRAVANLTVDKLILEEATKGNF